MNNDLIKKFNLTELIKERRNYTPRFVLLRITFFCISFLFGNILGKTVNYFLYPHIGNYCILVSIVLGFLIVKPFIKYIGLWEYELYLKWNRL
jgi:hypothetical protein